MLNTVMFVPLNRIVEKYKHDVNNLSSPASQMAIASAEEHLGSKLPPGLRAFLTRHNGASLLRGALRIRSAADMAIASEQVPRVFLFGETQDNDHWAWSRDDEGIFAFGVWDGACLHAQHSTFAGWLAGTIAVTETRVSREEDQAALRFDADSEDIYQLLHAGERYLRKGQPTAAASFFRKATAFSGRHVGAWQRLGDALIANDRSAARQAWLNSLRNTTLPLPWPGAPCLEPHVLRSLRAAFSDSESWERELERFLNDQVHDVCTQQEANIVFEVARTLARSLLTRGKRTAARDTLATILGRCRGFSWSEVPWTIALDLAELEIDLGNHDEAEALLRRLRKEGPEVLHGRGLLILSRIAITRQEPWAEEILDEALQHELSKAEKIHAAILKVERSIRLERLEDARSALRWALEQVEPMGQPALQAHCLLAKGDMARTEGRHEHALETYETALAALDVQDDAQLRYRLHLRIGDVYLVKRRMEVALEHFERAAAGFAELELPVREGWALLRVARLAEDAADVFDTARSHFERADLAAGVAAVDTSIGKPGHSLDWHVNRATAQARARYDAQRCKPPWERADAERPERRLGAHRLAIAACSEGVVGALAREMDSCARALASGRNRPTDPPVMRYIAAVDLVSGHRSYSAAQLLMNHLVNQSVKGAARRALQGAVARSPNAALVDGLLRCVEDPTQFPAPVVAEAAEALGLRQEHHAISALVKLASPTANPISRKAAITALGRIGDRSQVDVIIPALDDQSLEEAAALSLLMLGDRRGVDFHARALTENRQGLSGSPGEIVGRYGGPSHLLLLRNAASGADEGSLGALLGLGLLGDPRAFPVLLKALDHRDRRVSEVANGALQILSGHYEEMDQPGWKSRWNQWWEDNESTMPPGVRHRDGSIMDVSLLLNKMTGTDPWVRRTAYDELVITTGHALPFDSDGPYRTQQNHLRAWRTWWQEARTWLVPGNWYLDGTPVT